jgi:glycosyltransferase involved in cell wall biosynthesis
MMTLNGESLIRKSLLSVLPYCDECIVYDTGSIDRTVKILEELKKQFPHLIYETVGKKTPKELTVILNEMKQRSSGEWILRVDDDEVFPVETMEEIRNIDGQVIVYSIPFFHCENGGFINPKCHSLKRPGFFVARLFKNIPGINWVNDWRSEVLSYNGKRISSRAFQIHYCHKLENPFLHLGELRTGERKHEYSYHKKGHCWIPFGKYEKYV